MNKRLKKIILQVIASAVFFITFVYMTVLLCFSPVLFFIDVIDDKIKLIGPRAEIVSLINQKFLSLLHFNLGVTYDKKQLSDILMPYLIKSLELLILGILVGLIIGVLKGIIDSRRNGRDTSFKLLFSIIPLSLPDILIIALLQFLAIWLSKHGIKVLRVGGIGSINHLILPIIALALPCACYIARITAVSIEECYKKDYVKIALGKGCSPGRVLWNHVMRNVMGTIFKGLSNITAMVLCNMVIVEYLFSYPGLTMLLVKMQQNLDDSSSISIIIIIGIVYFVLDAVFRGIRLLIDQTQRGENA